MFENGFSDPHPLPRSFYLRSPELVAPDLLGKILIHRYGGEILAGRILETEAYLGLDDPASHAAVGKTPRNAALFGPAGHAYIYSIYGLHQCLNVSCLPAGEPGGVLFRALQPLQGMLTMATLRHLPATSSADRLAGGPGRLCQALGITRNALNCTDLTAGDSPLQIVDDDYRPGEVIVTPRVGIRKAADRPLRFLIKAREP